MKPLGVVTLTVKLPLLPLLSVHSAGGPTAKVASLFMVTEIFPKFGNPALAGQPAKPVRQPVVFGTVTLVSEVIVPLSAEKAIVVPAGMALPLRSTTETVNVRGAPAPPASVHCGNVIVAPLFITMLADEVEKTTTALPRTSMDFCVLQIAAPAVHSMPLYLASGPS
jgi:hypothetical protein